jgi:hypothetical protein
LNIGPATCVGVRNKILKAMPTASTGWEAMTNEQLRITETFRRDVRRPTSRSPKSGGRFAKAGGQLEGDWRRAWNFPAGGWERFFKSR